MSNTAVVVIIMLFAALFESLIIIVGNIFTIFVFWKHRNRLKQTSFLLINLAVADVLVGFTETIAFGTFEIPWDLEEPSIDTVAGRISTPFQTTFSFASVFFLVLISLERAYALIWPLRHRAASIKGFIYSATLAWLAGMTAGVSTMLAVFDILDFVHWAVAFSSTIALCLITVCVSYLAIRARLQRRVPAIDAARNRPEQNAKLSRTLLVVISASLLLWLPSIVAYCTHFLCSACVPLFLFHFFNIFRLANSLVNPIIYSFRMPMFREVFIKMKLCRQSKQYTINNTP